MKKVLVYMVVAVVAATVAGAAVFLRMQQSTGAQGQSQLPSAKAAVERRLQARGDDLRTRLDGFGGVVSRDLDFSMRLLVENNRSASEVTEMAARYLQPMGLSILEITDSSGSVLSSGHFPGNVGNTVDKVNLASDVPHFVNDNIKGRQALTFQVRRQFTIEGLRFECFGGWTADRDFLESLCAGQGVDVLLRHEGQVVCTRDVQSVSEPKDNMVVLNNQVFMADSVRIPGGGDGVTLLVLVAPPVKPGLLSLLR